MPIRQNKNPCPTAASAEPLRRHRCRTRCLWELGYRRHGYLFCRPGSLFLLTALGTRLPSRTFRRHLSCRCSRQGKHARLPRTCGLGGEPLGPRCAPKRTDQKKAASTAAPAAPSLVSVRVAFSPIEGCDTLFPVSPRTARNSAPAREAPFRYGFRLKTDLLCVGLDAHPALFRSSSLPFPSFKYACREQRGFKESFI
jgi:hypothetical protein